MSGSANLVYRLYRWFWAGLDLLYPPNCGGCGRRGNRWCADCQSKVQIIGGLICECCGQLLEQGKLCDRCLARQPYFAAIRSWAIFTGPLRAAIHQLKYSRNVGLAESLAQPLVCLLDGLNWPIQVIIPVPLGVARLNERGYNQSALLARPIALQKRLAYRPQALKRVRETRSQVGLSGVQRRDNVAGAFQASPNRIKDLVVLVVDDVATSSATLDACAAALCTAGARQVYGITVARAVWEHLSTSATG